MQIVFQVSDIKVGLNYGQASITVQPVEDLMYAIKVPDNEVIIQDGMRVITMDGMRTIIKGCRIALVVENETKKEDF